MTQDRNTLIAFILITIAIIIGGFVLFFTRPNPVEIVVNPPVPTSTPAPTNTPAPILVYVTGAVISPQATLELPVGSRVQDALDSVGGVLPNADMDRVNVAGIVRDGDHIHVYTIGEPEQVTLPTPGGGGIVYVNTATLEELETLPGIGPAIGQRIIDFRTQNGPFPNLASMEAVSGIGPVTLENIADLVSFE